MKGPLIAQTKHMHHLIVWKMDWESHQHVVFADMLTTAYDPYQAAKRTAEALKLSESQWQGTKPPYIIRYEGIYADS